MENSAEPSPKAAFWHAVNRVDKSKINSKWIAFRNSMAVALPLGIGIALGNPLAAVAITTGALNVSYSDGIDPYPRRARRMLSWSLLGALAVFTGSVTGKYHWAALLVAAAWAFVAGMCAAISTKAGDLGLNTLVALLVFAARGAMPLRGALITAALVLAGGLLQSFFALLLWPIRRYEPERRAIAKVYVDLALELKPQSDALLSGSLTAQSPQVQDALSALGKDHTLEGERFRLLFDQADCIRLSAFMVSRLRPELKYEERKHGASNENGASAKNATEWIDQLLETSSKLLDCVGASLASGHGTGDRSSTLAALEKLVEAAHALEPSALGHEIASAFDVLAGQLRAASELADHSTAEGLEGFAERETSHPWKLQVASWIATLRANLDPRSAFFRHAVRLSVCVAAADAIGRAISWERSYWIPMTVAVILKPDFTTTFSRGVLRLAGTFAGLIFATILYHALPGGAWRQLILVGIFTYFLRWLGPANYGVFSFAISGLIVFLIAATGVAPTQVVALRGLNTAAGGVLALIAYALWPTWERTQVADALAEMLDASRLYLQALLQRFSSGPDSDDVLNNRRNDWRRSRSNAEASVDRVSSEPRITARKLNCLTSILASSHALMHAMIGLEAGVIGLEAGGIGLEAGGMGPEAGGLLAPVDDCSQPFEKFTHDVEFTLYFLSAALRGSPTAVETLPKLREDHRRMVETRNSFSPTAQFVLIETDRITVSLNTLREQVMKYLS